MPVIRDAIERRRNIYYFTQDGKLVLFHGSGVSVPNPSVSRSIRCSECGAGFYAFINPRGAYWHRMRTTCALISVYELDVERLEIIRGAYVNNNTGWVAAYDKDQAESDYFKDMIFYIGGGSRFVNTYGGQFFTKKQWLLDEYVNFLGTYSYAELVSWFDLDASHLFKRRLVWESMKRRAYLEGLGHEGVEKLRNKFNRVYY